jgi:ribosome-binding protein aMBF1 (putative translation factor)
MLKKYGVKVVCDQLKEKWGEIRIYYSWIGIPQNKDELLQILYDAFNLALQKCEEQCSKTCEFCGDTVRSANKMCVTQGYIHYICRKCSMDHEDEITERFDKNSNKEHVPRIVEMRKGTGYDFLSPFSEDTFKFNKVMYNSVFSAYYDNIICKFENMKDLQEEYSKIFRDVKNTKPLTSYRIGNMMMKQYHIKEDLELMKNIIKSKFLSDYYEYKKELQHVKEKKIYFFNQEDDNFWGGCLKDGNSQYQNFYGSILEEVLKEHFDKIK